MAKWLDLFHILESQSNPINLSKLAEDLRTAVDTVFANKKRQRYDHR